MINVDIQKSFASEYYRFLKSNGIVISPVVFATEITAALKLQITDS